MTSSKPYTFRAVVAPAVDGKPAWHGQARRASKSRAARWHIVVNDAGLPISYTTADYARAAARDLSHKLCAAKLDRDLVRKMG
jgi:hypothetical protein